ISIQPSILEFHTGPAGTESQPVRITNLSGKKLAFQAYLADWLRDSTGGHQYFKADTLKRSCASWVELNRNYVQVEPNQTEELIVRLHAPSDPEQVKQMKWAMLFLQNADEQDSASRNRKELQTQVKEILRVGIHIYETPPSLVNKTVKAISLKQVRNEKNNYELLMKNTGDVMLQCKAYLELTNAVDGKTFKTDKIEFPVFPEGVRKVKLTVPTSVPKGKYSALAIIDLGEDLPLEGIEKALEVL
ncbi:MAG: hypothetical protein ACM3VS_07585, partial [Candidatus Dadabacteria bacterium]